MSDFPEPTLTDAPVPTAVYRLFGDSDALLYIGIAKTFGRRWHEHAQSQPWWPEVRRQAIDWHPSREDAIAAEAAAIKSEHPRYNRTHNYRGRGLRAVGAPLAAAKAPKSAEVKGWTGGAVRDPVPKIFTAEEAAALLKIVTAAWLKRHAANGDIPSVKMGRGRGFTAAQLGEIVLKFTEKPSASRPSRAPAARSAGGASVTALQARSPRRKQATA